MYFGETASLASEAILLRPRSHRGLTYVRSEEHMHNASRPPRLDDQSTWAHTALTCMLRRLLLDWPWLACLP